MLPWLGERYGNPSSRHPFGVAAAEAIDRARGQVARALGARPAEVVFTSGGTEANGLAVLGLARAGRRHGRRVIVGPTEHACVRESAQALAAEGFEVETARLDAAGALDLEHLAARLAPDTILVAQMLAQNEFGTVYPVREVARLIRARAPRARLHVDAVAAFGKCECSPIELDADSLAVSAHKVHGPQGAGALVLRGARPSRCCTAASRKAVCAPARRTSRRSSGWAPPPSWPSGARGVRAHRARSAAALVAALALVPHARVLAPGWDAHGGVDCVLAAFVPTAPAEVLMHHLEARGVYVSAGSACQARAGKSSAALAAAGLSGEEAKQVLRFSFARTTTRAQAERAGALLVEVCNTLSAALR
jgi:cysteine desulfurase